MTDELQDTLTEKKRREKELSLFTDMGMVSWLTVTPR